MTSPYVNRAGWGARPPSGSGNSLTGKGKGYCLHWEGPEMGERPHSDCDNLMRSIQNYHMDQQGWSDIAYNLAVCAHGTIYEGRGKGKGSGANGTSDANHNYPAICALVGEHDDQPEALHNGIADAVAMMRSWGVGSAQKAHSDFTSTACPGNQLRAEQDAGRFTHPTPAPTPEPIPPLEDTVPFLCRTEHDGATYTADTIHRRWIQTQGELNAVKAAYAERDWDATVHIIANLDAAGALVGPAPDPAK